MTKILGLDIGSSSIGWALIDDEQNKIIAMGVRIFPAGVENFGEGRGRENSKNVTRRENRQRRRQSFRKKMRKRMLSEVLHAHGMMPITRSELNEWKKTGTIPLTTELKEWFSRDPYELRHKALLEKISLEELGRVFYHLSQRRGFQTNSRSGETESKTLEDGLPKEGKIGIASTKEQMGEHTLGSYLQSIKPEHNASYQFGLPRIRNRYTSRSMYVDEFERIWSEQEKHHPKLTANLKEKIGGRKKDPSYSSDGVLFYQRPLRSQKFLIGKCSFEPTKPRVPVSHPAFERFRALQFINTIEVNSQKLSEEQRNSAYQLLLAKEKPKFLELRKKIGCSGAEFGCNYPDEHQCPGSYTISTLSKPQFFGNQWNTLSQKEQDDIWHIIFSADDKTWLFKYAQEKWGFPEKSAEVVSKLILRDGYGNLSKKAISNILPFLEKGYLYTDAVTLGGITKSFGDRWTRLSNDERKLIEDTAISIMSNKQKGGYIEDIKRFLKDHFELTSKDLLKLYHPSSNIQDSKLTIRLPNGADADREISRIKNPAVIQAVFELRKVVNSIIDTHGNPDCINVELARDLKSSSTDRLETKFKQAKNEALNTEAKKTLEEENQPVTKDNILKVRLWKECKKTCPYTGAPINTKQLFSGDVQIEHIIPWSRSIDDSFINKTLCFADENRNKGERTPYEYYSLKGENSWETVKARAKSLFAHPDTYAKFKRFVSTEIPDLDKFINRQLSDTRFISKAAKDYLKKICNNVNVAPGQMTAILRGMWGLNSIISAHDDIKTRDDHRHHAVDALVMAVFRRRYLQELAKWNRYHRSYDLKSFPMPWETFRVQAIENVNSILVSHKKADRVLTKRLIKTKRNGTIHTNLSVAARGQLHKEFIYGKHQSNGEDAYHIRKSINSITTKKQVDKIADKRIRNIIHDHIDAIGGYEKGNAIPTGAFFITDENGKVHPSIFLPNANGQPVPVYKVRMREPMGNAERLKHAINQYVNPRNNHHTIIYKKQDGTLQQETVSFWTAVERSVQGLPIVQLPFDGKEIITTIQRQDMFLLGTTNQWRDLPYNVLSDHLYKVQKIASGDYFMEICFRHHLDSRSDQQAKGDYLFIKNFGTGKTGWHSFNPIKVKVTMDGKIEGL